MTTKNTQLHPDGNVDIILHPETIPEQVVGLDEYIQNRIPSPEVTATEFNAFKQSTENSIDDLSDKLNDTSAVAMGASELAQDAQAGLNALDDRVAKIEDDDPFVVYTTLTSVTPSQSPQVLSIPSNYYVGQPKIGISVPIYYMYNDITYVVFCTVTNISIDNGTVTVSTIPSSNKKLGVGKRYIHYVKVTAAYADSKFEFSVYPIINNNNILISTVQLLVANIGNGITIGATGAYNNSVIFGLSVALPSTVGLNTSEGSFIITDMLIEDNIKEV